MESKKILIVDDEDVTLALLNRRLSAAGYEIIEAKSGEEATNKAQKHLPDLILMDIILPDIDGAETVQEIHANPPTKDIKVIFLSGIADQRDHEEVSSVKIGNQYYDIVSKPFDFEKLLNKIKKIISED